MSKHFSFACPDWEEKLRRGETPIAELPIDKTRAKHAVALFNSLRLPDVVGQPPLAEAGAEWFRDIVRAAFAARNPATGAQIVNEIFALVPKKNSKTTYSAALGLTALLVNERPNAQMLILGPTQSVSKRCFEQASGMIKADARLSKIFKVQDHLQTITRIKTGAQLKVKTFDMSVVTGEIPALTIIDELHVIASKSYASRVIGQIRGGMVTNPDALLVFITTQSDVPPFGAFKSELQMARAVRDGRATEGVRMLPVLYEFPEAIQIDPECPWRDPALWPMVLPNLGRSIQLDILRDQFAMESAKGREDESRWVSQHLNIEMGLARHDDRWAGADYWEENAQAGLDLDAMLECCDVIVAGGDIGGADDLFALTLIGRDAETRRWKTWCRCWCTERALERRKENAERYRDFEKDGDLVITDDTVRHVTEAADICEKVRDAGLFPAQNAVGLDPWGVGALHDELMSRGFGEDEIASISQGYKLSGAVMGCERRLADGKLQHGNQPILTWCVGNARAELRGSNVYITKQAAGVGKIDAVVAMFNAAMLMDRHPVAAGGRVSPWENPEFSIRARAL